MPDTTIIFKLIIITLLLLSSVISQASDDNTIYKSVGPHGEIIFTDAPPKSSYEIIHVPPLQTIETTIPKNNDFHRVKPSKDNPNYEYFTIVSPDDNTVLSNTHKVDVRLNIMPELRPEDLVQLYLNDKPYDSPIHTTTFEVHLLDRGTYQIRAEIIDKTQQILIKSNSIQIYLQQYSVLFKKK